MSDDSDSYRSLEESANGNHQKEEFSVPDSKNRLRACLKCRLIKSEAQWKRHNRCENCGDWSGYDFDRETTNKFDHIVSMINPSESWLRRKIRLPPSRRHRSQLRQNDSWGLCCDSALLMRNMILQAAHTALYYQLYMNKQTVTLLVLMSLLTPSHLIDLTSIRKWSTIEAHSEITVTVNIYNDNSRLVTGSSDNTVKIWSIESLKVIHTLTMADDVTHVSLHPTDNRIFVMVYNGPITVYDPSTYASVGSMAYPGGGTGNYIRFYDSNTKIVVGGFNTGVPEYYKFEIFTYTQIGGGVSTDFAFGDEITVMAVSKSGTDLAVISLDTDNLNVFNLDTDTRTRSYPNFDSMNWVLFSPYNSELYTACADKTVKVYDKNPSGLYNVQRSFFTDSYGVPYTLNANIKDVLVVGIDEKIVLLNISKSVVPFAIKTYIDQANIFVLDISADQKYLVTGMQNGEVSLWEISQQVHQEYQMPIELIVGIVLGSLVLLAIIACIVYHCFCKEKKAEVHTMNSFEGSNILKSEQEAQAQKNRIEYTTN